MNVATYGRGGRFAMTDRGAGALRQSADSLTIGPSSMRWDGTRLVIEVNEVAGPPRPGRLRGRIVLTPNAVTAVELPLTPDGRHVWRPFAPSSRIEVDLGPECRWSGHGYLDGNFGTAALEDDFDTWTWGRFPVSGGTACFYDAVRRDGSRLSMAMKALESGEVRAMEAPPFAPMARSLWAVPRETRADPGTTPRQVRGMLDAPFYSRSVVRTVLGGEETTGVHEALDLRRFASPWLKPMLALRVPRRAAWRFAG